MNEKCPYQLAIEQYGDRLFLDQALASKRAEAERKRCGKCRACKTEQENLAWGGEV